MNGKTLKLSVILNAFVLVLILAGSPLVDAQASAGTITLTYATHTGPTGLRGEVEAMFLEEIEKQTNGRVKVRPYWGSSLLKGKEILKGVNDGVVDMGIVNINYYPKRLILNSGVVLSQQGPVEYENKMWVYSTMFKEIPALDAEFKKFNQKIIYTYSVLPYAISFTKPVASLGEFKGLRIRAASRWALAVLKGTGAVPVSIPWGDCYMALQTKAVEGVYTAYNSLHRVKLDEVAPYVFVFKEIWVGTPYLITVSLDKWNKLPKDIQKEIEAASKVSEKRFAGEYSKWFDKVVAEEKKMGCTITFAKKEEIEQWVNLPEVKEIQEQWTKEAKAAGAKNADVILKRINEIVAEGIKRDKR
jgi:TRAP-type C4-dicarboxylate transport system substrate-binding protein